MNWTKMIELILIAATIHIGIMIIIMIVIIIVIAAVETIQMLMVS